MKKIVDFTNFGLNEEFSKNDPIPEITRKKDHLGIVLLGLPGSGKSTFANKFILPHNSNTKTFSTDDVSYMFTKDKSKFHMGSAELNIKYLHSFLRSGQNFIYDTTGSNDINVYEVTKNARKFGYEMLFILILIDVETAKKQNIKRGMTGGHLADDEYIDMVYSRQLSTTKSYLQYLKPDNFYVVLNKEGKYKYYKFIDGHLRKRKVDKYVPFIRESKENENDVDDIIDIMFDFVDEGWDITFNSSTGDMKYRDYIDKNSKYTNFKPVIKSDRKTVSKFSVDFLSKNVSKSSLKFINFDSLTGFLDEMQTAIGRLGDLGWVLSDFRVKTQRGSYGDDVKINSLNFEFSKPDVENTGELKLPSEDELREAIERFGIGIEDLKVGDYETTLDFVSFSYDGSLNSESFYEDKFEKICDIFGFSSYDLDYNRARVIFEY